MNIAFTLTMPGRNTWNGRWSGDEDLFVVIKNFRKPPTAFKLGYYSYNFGDGWQAAINVQEVTSPAARKMRKQSKGFCGYEWMIDSIIRDGQIYGPTQPKPEEVLV